MAQPLAKTVTISGVNSDGNTVELEIPAKLVRPTTSNDINKFERPKPDGGDPESRALNMNRIEIGVQVQASVSDDFAAKNHNGAGDRPNLDNKEDWMLELWKLAKAVTILDLKATNTKTHSEISEFSGYIHNLDWPEKGSKDNGVYEVTLKLFDEVPMTS